MSNGLYAIPKSWHWTTMGEISAVVGGGTPRTADLTNFEGGTIPWVTPADLSGYSSKYISHGERSITQKGLETSSARMLPAGTVLFTSRAPIGYIAIASNPVCTNQGFKSFVLKDDVVPDYVYWWLKGNKELTESLASGTTFLELSGAKAKLIPIPIAPLDEQKRIVAEVEKQFSRLDEVVASLKRAKANLKRYKSAVLKAALEGKLTEQWHIEHPDVEPAEKLLKRILTERRKKFEQADFARMPPKEKKPKDNKAKIKYREPVPPDYTTLPALPKGWCWSSTDQLFWFVTSGSRGWAKYYSNSGAIFLRVGNVDHDTIALDLKDIQRVDPPENAERTRTRVETNDILISITADVGMVAVVPYEFEEAYINQHISLARPVSVIESPYLGWYLAARPGQMQFRELQRGATKAGLGLDDIRSINIPLPPLEEQKEIVSQIERRLSIAHELNQDLDVNLRRAERLRQSILKKAFSGRLVLQIKNQSPN